MKRKRLMTYPCAFDSRLSSASLGPRWTRWAEKTTRTLGTWISLEKRIIKSLGLNTVDMPPIMVWLFTEIKTDSFTEVDINLISTYHRTLSTRASVHTCRTLKSSNKENSHFWTDTHGCSGCTCGKCGSCVEIQEVNSPEDQVVQLCQGVQSHPSDPVGPQVLSHQWVQVDPRYNVSSYDSLNYYT